MARKKTSKSVESKYVAQNIMKVENASSRRSMPKLIFILF